MAAITAPNLGIQYGWTQGETGWKPGTDANWLTLDALLQLSIIDRDLTAPPATPTDGDRYIVAPAATGAWTGHDGKVAVYRGGWVFYAPRIGWLCYIQDEEVLSVFKSGGWSAGVAI